MNRLKITKTWLATQPALTGRVTELRAEMTSRALGRLVDGMAFAADTLRKLLTAKSEMVRLSAARTVLELATRLRETVELEERLAVLEHRQEDHMSLKRRLERLEEQQPARRVSSGTCSLAWFLRRTSRQKTSRVGKNSVRRWRKRSARQTCRTPSKRGFGRHPSPRRTTQRAKRRNGMIFCQNDRRTFGACRNAWTKLHTRFGGPLIAIVVRSDKHFTIIRVQQSSSYLLGPASLTAQSNICFVPNPTGSSW